MTWFEKESCTFPQGFLAAGVPCGIKKTNALDLALLVSDTSACAAGVFTQNTVRAACIDWNRDVLRNYAGSIRGVVINSGNANAVTGSVGVRDNAFMASECARLIGSQPQEILVGSTGVIGVPLPMFNIAQGIRFAHSTLARTGGHLAAHAIMTTDKSPKHIAYQSPSGYRVGGMAKGAGMIHPNMATMISVITTDAVVSAELLKKITNEVTHKTFNCISIDGDTSTNDMFLVIANGASGIEPNPATLLEELTQVSSVLSRKIVCDAEGASRFVEIQVHGAQNEHDARLIARTISTSLLLKTAIFGADPNWGRVLAAAGRAGVSLDQNKVSLSFGGIPVFSDGQVVAFDEIRAHEHLKKEEVLIELHLGLGEASGCAWTSDLSHEYININSSYRT